MPRKLLNQPPVEAEVEPELVPAGTAVVGWTDARVGVGDVVTYNISASMSLMHKVAAEPTARGLALLAVELRAERWVVLQAPHMVKSGLWMSAR